MGLRRYRNCKLVKNNTVLDQDLWVRDGIIVDPEPLFYSEKILPDETIDCQENYISPGFIDLQINGAYGEDFSSFGDNLLDSLDVVGRELLKHGVTSYCPTIISSPSEVYKKALYAVKERPNPSDQAKIIGFHLEGPFISNLKVGAHPPQYLRALDGDFSAVSNVYGDDLGSVSIITLAPELPNSSYIIKELCKRGIVVSLGHSNCTLSEGEKGMLNGARMITHLFNAMTSFHHREPGLLTLLTSKPEYLGKQVFYGIIADGYHAHPTAVRLAYLANPSGLVLVSDAISATGLTDGHSKLGNVEVSIQNGLAYVSGTSTLCGSTTMLDECVKKFRKYTGCTTVEAINAATVNPAKVIGKLNRGTLNYGEVADFIILTEELDVLETYVNGKCVFQKSSTRK